MGGHDLAALTAAAKRAPSNSARWLALGAALREQSRLQESAQALLQAVRLQPSSAEASFQLSLTLEASGELDGASACLERVCELDARRFEAHRRLAFLQVQLGQPASAARVYARALELRPAAKEVVLELVTLLRATGDLPGAIEQCRRALVLDPTLDDVWLELGNALYACGRLDDAITAYRKLLERRPELGLAHANLGNALKDVGLQSDATGSYRRAVELAPDDALTHGNLLYVAAYDPEYTAQTILEEARRFSARHTEPLRGERKAHTNQQEPERRLRVGYVSSDFREHVSRFYLEPLLRQHSTEAVEVYCYSNVFPRDAWTERYQERAAVFREIWSLDDAAAAELIRADGIDVLVDLSMHSSRPRPLLFARKPAPIQLSWLAYVGTTGNDAMDYRLSDPFLDPESSELLPYTERTWRLPRSFWCFHPLSNVPPPGALPAQRNGYVTFGSLASFCKVNEPTLALWADVLNAVPGSKLVLHAPPGHTRARAAAVFERHGVAPSRLEFLPHQRRDDYLGTYARLDLCLDALPYCSLTNTLDAAYCGAPTLTLVGDTAVGRAGLSVASNLQLPQLVARDRQGFVASAQALASDLDGLAGLRASLRSKLEASPLMDAAGFARDLEAAYRGMWREWCTRSVGA